MLHFITSNYLRSELLKEKYLRLHGNKGDPEEIGSLRRLVEEQQMTITEQIVSLEGCSCRDGKQNYSDLHVSPCRRGGWNKGYSGVVLVQAGAESSSLEQLYFKGCNCGTETVLTKLVY